MVQGAVPDQLLQAAGHEAVSPRGRKPLTPSPTTTANLLGHPYIGVDDLEPCRLTPQGRIETPFAGARSVEQPAGGGALWVLGSRWRRRGLQQTSAARLAAGRVERGEGSTSP